MRVKDRTGQGPASGERTTLGLQELVETHRAFALPQPTSFRGAELTACQSC